MKFWDSSALVPLYVEEATTALLQEQFADDSAVYVWWATPVECVSGVAKLHREGGFTTELYDTALQALALASSIWRPIAPTDTLRLEAIRIVRVHGLKAADALQLAAAREWSQHRPAGYHFVSLDQRLRRAARLEGFTVLPQ